MRLFQSYKSIFKEASLFTAVQIILLIVSMIKGMIVAKYIGVEGTGILGVLQSLISFFVSLFSLGLPVLLMRSYALNDGDNVAIKQKYGLPKLMLLLALVGVFVFYFIVPFFAVDLFNDSNKKWVLKTVAIVILLKQVTSIYTTTLQGKQQLKTLAKATIISSIVGLLVAIPLYLFYKLEGVVYGFVLSFFIEVIVARLLITKSNTITNVSITINEYKEFLRKGFLLGYANVLTLAGQLGVVFYITVYGGVIAIGNYNAGFSIINNYVALLFVAMSTGYLPRIIKLLENKCELENEIAKQLNFSLIIIGVLATFCILFAPFIVHVLFSKDFEIVIPFLRIAVIGMLFKTFSWCLGYLIIAKADTKVMAFTGVIFNTLFVLLLICGYQYNGIIGTAYAFVIYNFIHLVSIWSITKVRYQLKLPKNTILLLLFVVIINLVLVLL